MNVASLRSSESAQTSAECKLAKVALMTISLWFFAWTPYLVTNYTGIFEGASISPLATIWCSLFAKANAVYNPIVYAIRYAYAMSLLDLSLSVQISPIINLLKIPTPMPSWNLCCSTSKSALPG